jgi:hypothetical protein
MADLPSGLSLTPPQETKKDGVLNDQFIHGAIDILTTLYNMSTFI